MEGFSTRTGARSQNSDKCTKKKTTLHSVTENELVRSRKRVAAVRPLIENSFQTTKYKNLHSAWTPVIHSEFNNKIFLERMELIGHWFSMWTDAQRKKFISFLLKRCTRSQLKFVNEGWFKKELPIHHLDFTTVLPRFISEYIFSFLDPRTLCRIAQVSWHWKFLSEQDKIWLPKCLRFGWYLPYTPSSREYGAWKNHYILCLNTLDIESPAKNVEVYGKFCSAGQNTNSGKKKGKTKGHTAEKKKKIVKEILYFRNESRRPPWIDTDSRPRDLELVDKALYKCNPNQPISQDELRAQRLGLSPRPHQRSLTAPTYGVQRRKVTKRVRSASGGFEIQDEFETEDTLDPSKLTLSEFTAIESRVDANATERPWSREKDKAVVVRRQDLTVGLHPTSHDSFNEVWTSKRSSQAQPNPAVLLISSEIPACEVLLDAVMFGVVVVPYEYEAATLDSLLERLRLSLKGRQARSVGVFAKGDSGTVRLVKGQALSEESLTYPDMRQFWETVTTAAIPLEQGGHVDIFVPLTDTERGMDLLVQLGVLTGMQFSCPTGSTGSFARVESEWLFVPDGVAPPALYFNVHKLGAWCNDVDYLEECTLLVKANLQSYFSEEKKNLARRLIGRIVFEALGLSSIHSLSQVAPVLVDALVSLSEETCGVEGDALHQLIVFLQAHVSRSKPKKVKRKVIEDDSESVRPQGEGAETEILEEDEGILSGDQELEEKPRLAMGQKRVLVAHEVLSTEVEYMRSLAIIQDAFKKPLQAALSSNRAIISLTNLQTLFGDLQTLYALSCLMVDDLSNRLKDWDSHQCLGDIFVKFTAQLRAYTNFLNNYPVALSTIERCREQSPQFRAFLERHEKQPNTKMMSLPEFFLIPGKRMHSYVQLLECFLRHTPPGHKDRNNLIRAIARLKDMDTIFREYRDRLERETFLQDMRKRIVNCPVLAEKNRHFVVQEDVIQLNCPSDGTNVKPEYRVYQQVSEVGFFLFNDALVVTSLTCKYVPFRRLVNHVYKFQTSVTLKKLKIENIPDSKYIKNAFRIVSPKRLWLCQAHSWNQKQRWLATLETAVTAAIENS